MQSVSQSVVAQCARHFEWVAVLGRDQQWLKHFDWEFDFLLHAGSINFNLWFTAIHIIISFSLSGSQMYFFLLSNWYDFGFHAFWVCSFMFAWFSVRLPVLGEFPFLLTRLRVSLLFFYRLGTQKSRTLYIVLARTHTHSLSISIRIFDKDDSKSN